MMTPLDAKTLSRDQHFRGGLQWWTDRIHVYKTDQGQDTDVFWSWGDRKQLPARLFNSTVRDRLVQEKKTKLCVHLRRTLNRANLLRPRYREQVSKLSSRSNT